MATTFMVNVEVYCAAANERGAGSVNVRRQVRGDVRGVNVAVVT